MTKRCVIVPVVLGMFFACTTSIRQPLATTFKPSPTSVELTVINAADNATGIPGARITIVTHDGTELKMGETDSWGRVTLPVEATGRGRIILFCHPLFYCGALRSEDLSGFTDRTIAIAPVVLR